MINEETKTFARAKVFFYILKRPKLKKTLEKLINIKNIIDKY